jgi:RecA/RadA recombinase
LEPTEQLRLAHLYEQLRLKLLDLSKKNRMLNYSFSTRSKRHLQIVDEVLEEIYRKLGAEENLLEIRPLEEPDEIPTDEKNDDFISAFEHAKVSDVDYLVKLEALESEARDDEVAVARLDRELRDKVRIQLGLNPRPNRKEINRADHARTFGIDPSLELPPNRQKDAHTDQVLQTLKYPDELESFLEKISDDARLAEQEMGVSTLFLAFGFLEWYEADHSDKNAFAPLLLLPVRLEDKKVKGKTIYFLSAREGVVEANLSLQKLLEKDFSRELPEFESNEEDPFGSIETYLQRARSAIDGLKRWNIRRWLVLGHFSFGRFAMYADLKPENWPWHPADHDLVMAILSGVERTNDGSELPTIPEDYLIDDPEIEKIAPILIHDADASQHSALIDVMKEKNLVIQGPPGTGKSQTITNIVANALAAGKRVLFLAEKLAALEVVKRRLDQAGLGDFCLELHSDKASSKTVINSLRSRWELGWGQSPRSYPTAKDATWVQSRDLINRYTAALHKDDTDGATPFNLIWKAIRGKTLHPDVINLFSKVIIPPGILSDPPLLTALLGQVEIYAQVAESFALSFGHPANSPWASVQLGEVQPNERPRLVETLIQLRDVGVRLDRYFQRYDDLGARTIVDIDYLIAFDNQIGNPPDDHLLVEIANLDLDELERGLILRRDIIRIESELKSLPDLCFEKSETLALATSVLRNPVGVEFCAHTARQAYELARERQDNASAVIGLLNEFLPVLDHIGLDRSHPVNGLNAVAVAAVIASKIDPEHRNWMGELPSLQDNAFAPLLAKWEKLVSAESGWRKQFLTYGERTWPRADEIRSAANFLRKKGIEKWISGLTSAGKAARALVKQLCLEEAHTTSVALDSLAQHVQELTDFENDPKAANRLDRHWRGLSTPFESISNGMKLRGFLEQKLSAFPLGTKVSAKVLSLNPDQIEMLGAHAGLWQRFQTMSPKLKSGLDGQSIDQFLAMLNPEIDALQQFLALDPRWELARIELPIEQIAKIAERRESREKLTKQIEALPTRHAIEAMGRTEDHLERATAALAWIRTVQRSSFSDSLKDRLSSLNASEERNRLREAAGEGASLKETYQQLIAVLARDFGICNLETLTAPALIQRVAPLVDHQIELGDFLALRRQREILAQAGLADFLASADKLLIDAGRLTGIFEACVGRQRANRMRQATQALAGANGQVLEACRKTFADRDRLKIEGDRRIVKDALLRAIPPAGSNYGPRKTWTDTALLRNEFAKQSRFTPVRSVLMRAAHSVQTLKPCFMMSSLSLAKFLTPAKLEFDLVVIDEASQMKPEDALGG